MAIYHSNHKKLECKGEFNSFSQFFKDSYSNAHALKVDRIIAISSLGLLGLTISSGVILSSSVVSADDTSIVDEVNITVPVSCAISGTGMQSHNTEIANGTYTPDIGSTTLHAFCNDNEGFAIYATGYTGNEVGGTNSNKLVGTAASNNATIESGIATTAGNPDVSNWAMKLTMTQDSGDTTTDNAFTIDSAPNVALPSTAESGATQAPFSAYHVVPNEYVKVAHKNSMTDMTEATGGVKLTTTYAAYISKTQPADTYSGQVIYTLVHPSSHAAPSTSNCEPGYICYDATAKDVIGQMGNQKLEKARDFSSCYYTDNKTYCADIDQNGIDIATLPELDYYTDPTLMASNFSRLGYGFAGWSDSYDYATNPNANFYGPNETIAVPDGIEANGLSLYAIWIRSVGSIQSDGASTCDSLTQAPAPESSTKANLSSVSALTDDRDGNTYAIAKLADGKCWTIENLRLDDSAELSSTNTHNPSLPFTNIYDLGVISNRLSPTSSLEYDASAAPEGWCVSNIGKASCLDQSRLRTDNTILYTSNTSTSYDPSGNVYSYGNYYNWYSATAGHGTSSKSSGNVAGDICPANWHLPTGGSATAEYGALDVAMGGTGWHGISNVWSTYPSNFVYSGTVYLDSITGRSLSGSYWSSSPDKYSGTSEAYSLGLDAFSVTLDANDYKYYGNAVRCINGT